MRPAVQIDDDAASDYLKRLVAQRAMPQPIAFHASTRYSGIASREPRAELLLEHSIGWVDIAARAIASRISTLDLEVVTTKRVDGVEKEIALPDHDLARLLRRMSPMHTSRQALRLIAYHVVTVGVGYFGKIGRGTRVLELHVMAPARVRPVLKNAVVEKYVITDGNGREIEWPAEEVVRIFLPDPSTLYGARGYLGPQAITADTGKFTGETLRAHFESDATPKVILESERDVAAPDQANKDAFWSEWRQNYDRRAGGARGLPAFLPSGVIAKIVEAGSGEDLVAVLNYVRDTILAAYNVPKSIAGLTDDAGLGRATAETNQYVFDLHGVTPIADLIADALTEQLARPQYGEQIRVRFKPFVSTDKDYELRREAQDLDKKIRTVDEVRGDRGMKPSSWGALPVGSFADTPYTGEEPEPIGPDVPGALGGDDDDDDDGRVLPRAARLEATGRPALSSGGGVRAASPVDLEWKRFLARERTYVPQFEKRVRRIFAAQEAEVRRDLAAEGLGRSYARDLTDAEVVAIVRRALAPARWSKLFATLTNPVRRAAFVASGKDALTAAGSAKKFDVTERVVSILSTQNESFRARVSDTTLKALAEKVTRALAEGAAAGESASARAKRIETAVGEGFDLRRSHARTIARTETLKATQTAQLEGYAQSGVVRGKQWNDSRDDAVRDSHQIDGQVVELDGVFRLANGRTAEAPGADSLPAEDVIGCRCFVTPVLEEVDA